MSQKSAKSAAELESMIMAELREHPSAGVVVIRPKDVAWDAARRGGANQRRMRGEGRGNN
jgi:hypothetical protein